MSLKNPDVVDFISINEKDNSVLLTMSDDLVWTNGDQQHLRLLENKLNRYLSFIESGELYETYENATDKEIVIELVCKYPLNDEATEFVDFARTIVMSAGFRLGFRLFNPIVS